jgi:hypothetical protein
VPTFQGLLGARRAYLLALQHSTSISNTIQVAARDNSVAKRPIPDLVAARGFTGHVPGKSVHADDVVASHRIEQHAARNTRLPAAQRPGWPCRALEELCELILFMYRLELMTNLRNCTLAGFREEQLLTRRGSGKWGQVVAAHLTAELAHLTSGGGGGNQQDSKSGLCRRGFATIQTTAAPRAGPPVLT